VSIGLCHVEQPQENDSLSAVFSCADGLLYDAKAAGRNCVKIGLFDRGVTVQEKTAESAG
jgi:PleD family two-component response regulator